MNAYLARGTVAAAIARLEELALRAGRTRDATDCYHVALAEGAVDIALDDLVAAVKAEQVQVAA